MKKPFRLTSLLLALCLAAAWLPQAGIAAGEGTIHAVSDNQSVLALFTQGKVKDGDTIRITGNGAVLTANDAPWIIDKNVTITGGAVVLRAGGIVLGADVTFKDTRLSFSDNVRNAIVANGHTLTLENVACDNFSFNLFCGGLIKSSYETFQVPAPGNAGTIYIKGNTTLQKDDTYGSGNIYAGNLCMGGMNESANGPENNGPANVFNGDAVINVEGSGNVGTVYACGAQQRIPVGAPNGKVTLPDAARYTVSGSVTVNGNVPDVEGAGAGKTHVVYRNDSSYSISRAFSSLSSLSVEQGNLALKAESHSLDGAAVSLADGARLNLTALAGRVPTLGSFTGGSFTGGGFLILGKSQTLPISGKVTGTTKVAVGYTSSDNEHSMTLPTQGWCYIQAPNFQDDALFTLLPYAGQPGMALERDETGNWTIPAAGESGDAKLERLDPPENTAVSTGTPAVYVPLNTTYTGENMGLDMIPLILRVNGVEAAYDENDRSDKAFGLWLYAGLVDGHDGEVLEVLPASYVKDAPIPDNVYRIEIVVPGAYTASGTVLTASFTLTVGDVTTIPVPRANPGLVWTGAEQTGVNQGTGYTLSGHRATNAGSYTATAALASGYRWEDGTAEDKSIPWSIGRSPAAPPAPTALAGVAPTSTGGADGKITGTTAEMEYSASAVFSAPQNCGAGETAGLAAGTYYVRVKGSGNRVPGEMAQVIVPAHGEPIPEHQHSWSEDWSSNATHHWHNCTGENCPIQEDNRKEGYAAHAPGEWITDRAPTATEAGSRHRSCTVCGYETARETLPATGGGSSGGGSSGGGSSGGGSFGGGSSGGGSSSGSNPGTTTGKNPDGSTTTTKTDKTTGTVTETTKRPDGSSTVVETKKDGTVTTTDTAKDGSTVTVVAHPGGPVETTVKQAGGLTASLTAHQGSTRAEVWLPSGQTQEAAGNSAVALPIPALPGDHGELSIHTGRPQPVRVEIPVEGGSATTVACLVDQDGREHIIKTAAVDGDKIALSLPDGAVIRFRDGGRSFDDVGGHWAEEAIRFVAARELFLGQADSKFGPDGSMTRGMLMVVLARLDGLDAAGEKAYEAGMSWAVAKGVSDGRNPEEQVTREQFITMLYRYAGSPAAAAGPLSFSDEAAISSYARDGVCWAVENGILSGFEDGSVLPQGPATRAQAAMILVRYVDYLNRQ